MAGLKTKGIRRRSHLLANAFTSPLSDRKAKKRGVSLTSGTLFTLMLSSSVVSALVTQGFSQYDRASKHSRDRAYSALRVAANFENYGNQLVAQGLRLSTMMDDSGRYRLMAFPRSLSSMPEMAPFASDIDWKTLSTDTTSIALSAEAEIRMQMIKPTTNVDLLYRYQATKLFVDRAREVFGLAKEIRATYSLPASAEGERAWQKLNSNFQTFEKAWREGRIIEPSPGAEDFVE